MLLEPFCTLDAQLSERLHAARGTTGACRGEACAGQAPASHHLLNYTRRFLRAYPSLPKLAVGAFPGVSDKPEVGPMLELATLILKLRTLILAEKWTELLAALEAITLPSHLVQDEVLMARQEYLTHELERAATALEWPAAMRPSRAPPSPARPYRARRKTVVNRS